MPNKNISNYPLGTPVTGDYLLLWDVSLGATVKVYVNRIVALAPDEAETFLLSGVVSGRNVGPGEGTIFHGITNNIAQFKTLKQGNNITLTNNSGDVTITAASFSESGNQNVGPGEGTIFHSNANGFSKFKTLKAGSNVTLTNNSGDVTIAASASTSDSVSIIWNSGVGNSYDIPYGGDGLSQPVYSQVSFGASSPVVSLPAGTNNYLIDFIFGIKHGSTSTCIWAKLRDTTNNRDIPNSLMKLESQHASPNGQYHIRVMSGFTGPLTIRPYALHSGNDDETWGSSDAMPKIISTGTTLTAFKAA